MLAGIHPDDDGFFDWINSLKNAGSADASVQDFVRCSDGYELRYRSRTTTVKRDAAGKELAPCKAKEAVTGGGLRSTNTQGSNQFDAPAVASRPWDSRKDRKRVPDDGWLVKVHNGTGQKVELTAYAVCKR